MHSDEWYRKQEIGLYIVTAIILLIAGLFYLKYLLVKAGFTLYKFLAIIAYIFGFILVYAGLKAFVNNNIERGLMYLLYGLAFILSPYIYFMIYGANLNTSDKNYLKADAPNIMAPAKSRNYYEGRRMGR